MKKKFRGYLIRLFNSKNEEYDSLSFHDVFNIFELNREILDYELEYDEDFFADSNNAEKIIIEKLYY